MWPSKGRFVHLRYGKEALTELDQAEALYRSSLTRAQEGRFAEALELAQAAGTLRPDAWEIEAQIGVVLLALYRPEDAIHWLRSAAKRKPDQAEVANNYGAALRALGRLELAREQFQVAIRLDPTFHDAQGNLASTFIALGRHAEAIEVLENLAKTVQTPDLLDRLGHALWKSGRLDEATKRLDEALAIDPAYSPARAHLGNVAVEAGRLDEAKRHFAKAIALAPNSPEYYRLLAQIDARALTKQHRDALISLAQAGLPPHQQVEADFALARYYQVHGDRERSFDHLVAANTRARSLQSYDEAETLAIFDATCRLFTPDLMAMFAGAGNDSNVPVFIVGMPRSGTSLVEQMLASHPFVYGAGELVTVQDLALELFSSELTADGFRAFGDRYVESVTRLAPMAKRITDKMPLNFRYVGLIHLALPNAKFIHTRRDPLDTCFSCFSNSFESAGMAWTCDLSELGRYYRGYERLMEHWQSILPPGVMLEVQYEDVIADFETQARRLVDFIGLPWDDRVLEFHKTERSVKTASAAQVRRPLYRSSVGGSRAYGELLQPLFKELL